jgi:hypothetical protein
MTRKLVFRILFLFLVDLSALFHSLKSGAALQALETSLPAGFEEVLVRLIQFTAEETNTLRGAGLSNGNTGTSVSDIDFCVQLNPVGAASYAYIRENGVY